MWYYTHALYIKYYTLMVPVITYYRLFYIKFTTIVILCTFLTVSIPTHPHCQLSLWEETGAPGENRQLSAERRVTLITQVRSENQTHKLRGERRLLYGECILRCIK
jgi:hypothetical protein